MEPPWRCSSSCTLCSVADPNALKLASFIFLYGPLLSPCNASSLDVSGNEDQVIHVEHKITGLRAGRDLREHLVQFQVVLSLH